MMANVFKKTASPGSLTYYLGQKHFLLATALPDVRSVGPNSQRNAFSLLLYIVFMCRRHVMSHAHGLNKDGNIAKMLTALILEALKLNKK